MKRSLLHSLLICALLAGLLAAYLIPSTAVNAGAENSLASNMLDVKAYLPVIMKPDTPPVTPSNLTATAVSSTAINLAWKDNSNNETQFEIERAPLNSTAFQLIATTGANVTTYQNTGLTPATGYQYRVRAVNSAGGPGYTNVASATTLPAPPAAPTGLNASGTTSNSTILKWTDNANNETGFQVEKYSGGIWVQVAGTSVLGPNSTQYTVTGLLASTSFKFRVRAVNQGGYSAWSNEVPVTTLAAPVTVPTPPSNLTYSNLTATTVRLSWVDNSNNETWFELQESVGGGPWTTISSASNLPANYTYADVSDLLPDTDHAYRIRAVNAAGSSAFSNTVSFHTPSLPAQTKLRVTNNVTDDFIVSLKINNIEQIPTWDKSISPGTYKEYPLSPGSYTIVATTGWWDTQANPPSRFEKYIWTYSVSLTAGQTTNIQVNDPTIQQILTNFDTKAAWKGYYFAGTNYGEAYFCFYQNGKYRLYDTVGGYFEQVDYGSYQLVSYGSVSTRFMTVSSKGQGNYEGLIDMLRGYYTMNNGPSGWTQITYTRQTANTSSQLCPATSP